MATEQHVNEYGVQLAGTPPGQHNQVSERVKQAWDRKIEQLLHNLHYKFDFKEHPHLILGICLAATDILNEITVSRTAPYTPARLFYQAKAPWRPYDILPTGVAVEVLDTNTSKKYYGIMARNCFRNPGQYFIYDPQTRRKPLIRTVVRELALEHQIALYRQWGFLPQATLNPRMTIGKEEREKKIMDLAASQQEEQVSNSATAVPSTTSRTIPTIVPNDDEVADIMPAADTATTVPVNENSASVPAIVPVNDDIVTVPSGDDASTIVPSHNDDIAIVPAAAKPASVPVRDDVTIVPVSDDVVSVPTSGDNARKSVIIPVVDDTAKLPAVEPTKAPAHLSLLPSEGERGQHLLDHDINKQMSEAALQRLLTSVAKQKSPSEMMQRMVLLAVHDAIDREFPLQSEKEVYAASTSKKSESGTAVLKRFRNGTPAMQAAARLAIRQEAKGHLDRDLGKAVHPDKMNNSDYYNALRTMVLLKEKVYPNGDFEKLKARLVVLGNFMKEGTYGSTYAPTINQDITMFLLTLFAADKADMNVWDVPSAFINTPIEEGPLPARRVCITDPDYIAEWLEHRPEDKKCLTKKGHLVIELKRYLYGMKDAPARFHDYLRHVLAKAGFYAVISDTCLIFKFDDEGYFAAGGHVDDLLGGNPQGYTKLRDEFEAALSGAFGEMERKPLTKGNYLGMAVAYDQQNGEVILHQPKHIQTLHDRHPEINWNGRKFSSPGNADFFKDIKKDPTPVNKTEYLSLLQEARYIADRTRRELQLYLNELAGASVPVQTDMDKLHRVVTYLWQTRDLVLKLAPKGFQLEVFADASYALHSDGYSHTGIVILLGGAPFLVKSKKQKILATASTDAEYDALTEAVKYIEWFVGLYEELGVPLVKPITVYQDNMSTIHLATKPGTYKNSKHALVRYAYVKHHAKLHTIKLVYCPTDKMLADGLTKPLQGPAFLRAREALGIVTK